MIDRVSRGIRRWTTLAAAAAITVGLAGPAVAGIDDAKATVEQMANEALRILDKTENVEERERKFRDLFRENFAVQKIGRFVLGPRWPKDDAEKRSQFLDVFERYVITFYTIQLNKYAGEEFKVLGGREQGEGRYLVNSVVTRPQGDRIPLDWELEDGGNPQVVDLRVENISLRITQRDEFRSVIKSRGAGVDGLIAALEEKIEQLDRQQ